MAAMAPRGHSFVTLTLGGLLFAVCGSPAPPDLVGSENADPSDDARPPNIVFFLADDLGWMDTSTYGSRYYETPNVERLARAGMTFTDAYAASPLCSPTRASLLTGKAPERLGFTMPWGHRPPIPERFPRYLRKAPSDQRLLMPRSESHLPTEEVTIAEALRDAGYATAHIGKWHVGVTPETWPDQQGFDVTFHGAPDQGPPSYFAPYGFEAGNVVDGPDGEYITDRVTEEALDFLETHRDGPFLLHVWHYAVHGPWGHKAEVTERFAETSDPTGRQGNPIMASMIWSLDESLGRILDKLEELELTDDTVVVFTSDNGGSKYDHVSVVGEEVAALAEDDPARLQMLDWQRWAGNLPPTNNEPLREGKAWIYEGGTRVPLVVSWPGRVAAGARTEALVSSQDFFATFLELAGQRPPDGRLHDGISFTPALLGDAAPASALRDSVFAHFPHTLPRLKDDPGRMAGSAVRTGRWKLLRWYDRDVELELFDLDADLSESQNVAVEHPDVVARLRARLDQHLADSGAYLPKPNPAYAEVTEGPGAPGDH